MLHGEIPHPPSSFDDTVPLADATSAQAAPSSGQVTGRLYEYAPTYYVWGQDLSGSLQGAGGIGGLRASP